MTDESRKEDTNGIDSVEPRRHNRGVWASMAPGEIFRYAFATVILIVWAIIYLNAYLGSSHITPPAEFSGVMLGVVAWLYGGPVLRKGKKNGDG